MKRKNFFTVVSAVLVMAVVLSFFAVPSFARRKLGDVDGDGFITSADARIALRASVKLETLSAEQEAAANVDDDQFVTSADARLILRASVKLEELKDVFVGEETTEPEPPETTTEQETPETTTVPETPETTTVPEAPETTTVPETPETTTEPEEPTNPDTPVVTPPAANNEFDILRSGTYYFTGETVDAEGRNAIEIARTGSSLYLGSSFNGVKVGVLTVNDPKKGDLVYLVNPNKNTYLDLNNAATKLELSAVGIDVSAFSNSDSFDFSFFPPLSDATRSETTPEGYVKYVFDSKEGAVNITMDGSKLLCLENARNGNVYRIDFLSVSGNVPSQKRETKNLTKALLMSAFLISLFKE